MIRFWYNTFCAIAHAIKHKRYGVRRWNTVHPSSAFWYKRYSGRGEIDVVGFQINIYRYSIYVG